MAHIHSEFRFWFLYGSSHQNNAQLANRNNILELKCERRENCVKKGKKKQNAQLVNHFSSIFGRKSAKVSGSENCVSFLLICYYYYYYIDHHDRWSGMLSGHHSRHLYNIVKLEQFVTEFFAWMAQKSRLELRSHR